MSTATRSRPSRARGERAVRPPERGDAETRIVLRGIGWEVYDALSNALPDGTPVRMTYDGKDLEIMTTSGFHDFFKYLVGLFVHEVAMALGVPMLGLGQTTWKRPRLARGLEADESFYFLPEKIPVAMATIRRKSTNIADYPDPDLAIEIDISPPTVDREEVYRKLRIGEVWYFDGEHVRIEQLGDDGAYTVASRSRFLPIKDVEIRRWLVEEDSSDHNAWGQRLRAWLRRIARSRKPAPRRPGRRKKDG